MCRRLPNEAILKIIEEIVNTRAIFVFDVDVEQQDPTPGPTPGPPPDEPILPENPRLCFRPLVNPPTTQFDHASWPGTYESQISKTIRSLLLTNRWINKELCDSKEPHSLKGVIRVPTTSGHGIVRFNPGKHIICIRNVNYTGYQVGPWTGLDININHLAFMGGNHTDFSALRLAVPCIQYIYGVFFDRLRNNPSRPIDFIWPARERHTLSMEFLSSANEAWGAMRRELYSEQELSHMTPIPHLPTLPFLRLVLI